MIKESMYPKDIMIQNAYASDNRVKKHKERIDPETERRDRKSKIIIRFLVSAPAIRSLLSSPTLQSEKPEQTENSQLSHVTGGNL